MNEITVKRICKTGWKNCKRPELSQRIAKLETLIVRAYTSGYLRGHDDTVEGCFTDVFPVDQDTYFEEEVTEWIKEQIDER